MSMYQALYENVSKELKDLEERVEELELKRQLVKDEYDKSKDELEVQGNLLTLLTTRKDIMPYKYDFVIRVITGVLVLGIGLSLIGSYLYGLTKFLLLFPVFIQALQPLVTLFLVIGFIGTAFISSKIGIKFQNKLENKSIQRIINSKEYQELLSRINVLGNEIDIIRENTIEKEKAYELANEEYETCKMMRDEKKILIEYIAKQMQPVETTLHRSKSYKREYCGDNSCSCY